MQRTRLPPNIITGRRNPVVILDAALKDKRLLDLRMIMKGDVSTGFELEQGKSSRRARDPRKAP